MTDGATGIRNARNALREALDRQSRADTSEAWLADETAAQTARDKLAYFGCDVQRIESNIRLELARLDETGSNEA